MCVGRIRLKIQMMLGDGTSLKKIFLGGRGASFALPWIKSWLLKFYCAYMRIIISVSFPFCSWQLVIHAGIDGYSRLPVYCYCSTNNRADTVLSLFQDAVNRYGMPSRVRCDRGGENVGVAMFMLENRGCGRSFVIAGRSVHNHRIERWWRDFFQGCILVFYNLFYELGSVVRYTHFLPTLQ